MEWNWQVYALWNYYDLPTLICLAVCFIGGSIVFYLVKMKPLTSSYSEIKSKINKVENGCQDISAPIRPIGQISNYGTNSKDEQKPEINP